MVEEYTKSTLQPVLVLPLNPLKATNYRMPIVQEQLDPFILWAKTKGYHFTSYSCSDYLVVEIHTADRLWLVDVIFYARIPVHKLRTRTTRLPLDLQREDFWNDPNMHWTILECSGEPHCGLCGQPHKTERWCLMCYQDRLLHRQGILWLLAAKCTDCLHRDLVVYILTVLAATIRKT